MSENDRIKELEQIIASKDAEIEKLQAQINGELKNPRGAGRKKNDDAWKEQIGIFTGLYQSGADRKSIMQEMGISQATFYRYKKEAETK